MFSFFVTVLVLIQVIATSGGQSVSDERNQQTCVPAGVPGVPGSPGLHGSPGRDGMKGGKGIKGEKGLVGDVGSKGNAGKIGPQGIKGEQGRKGETASKGEKGLDGAAGAQGIKGEEGRKGERGIKGERGLVGDVGGKGNAGEIGLQGPQGARGIKGETGRKGEKGIKGERGFVGDVGGKGNAGKRGQQGPRGPRGIIGETGRKGEKGKAMTLNWKQCVWDRSDWQDSGLIQNCNFRKHDSNSALHVAYAGNLRVLCSSGSCCTRWYFTFNNNECSGPMTIEGIVYGGPADDNPAHHRQIEGYCENIGAGQVTIGFNIGNCRYTSTTYDGLTGWQSVSRIMIAEVLPSQK